MSEKRREEDGPVDGENPWRPAQEEEDEEMRGTLEGESGRDADSNEPPLGQIRTIVVEVAGGERVG